METICKFDKKKDIAQVEQFGFVDTIDAEKSGYVRPDLSPSPESFDGLEVDPESIIGRPRDAFHAMRMQEDIASGIKQGTKPKTNE